MAREDRQVLKAVAQARPAIVRAVKIIAEAFRKEGRLFFIGAGTSGRLGVLEAAECPPTFNTPPSWIQAVMAGGRSSVFRSKEGAEDSEKEGSAQVRKRVRKGDVVVGIAASGVTPFVRAALSASRRLKARTVLVTCNPHPPAQAADIVIALPTGPEILSGSTRLKAGSACKMALNMLTTASMVALGKVYGNRMVDLQPKSRKLKQRGIRLIRELGFVGEKEAGRLLKESHGHVKIAIVMARKQMSFAEAAMALKRAKGFLRAVL